MGQGKAPRGKNMKRTIFDLLIQEFDKRQSHPELALMIEEQYYAIDPTLRIILNHKARPTIQLSGGE